MIMQTKKLKMTGYYIAAMKVQAEVCLHCGGRVYPQETVKRFEEIRGKLEREEVSSFKPLGKAFLILIISNKSIKRASRAQTGNIRDIIRGFCGAERILRVYKIVCEKCEKLGILEG